MAFLFLCTMNKNPIGIFDSGIGGTSIFKELEALMPYEDMIYLADSKNAPYGDRTSQEIIDLSIKNVEFLLKKKCKLIVVACNTATTNAITVLRKKFDIPFIGIEPAIKPAALSSKTKAVGILATKGTLSSSLFHETTKLHAHGIKVIEQIGEGLVPLIESGKLESKEMRSLLESYIDPMIKANIDYLVLGCTHYPYLIPQLLRMLPNDVKIIDSGLAVARQTQHILEKNKLSNSQNHKGTSIFYSNGTIEILESILGSSYKVEWEDF